MSEQKCQSCKWFEAIPGHVTFIGRCEYPLPAWLDAHLFWARGGTYVRTIEKGYVNCSTHEAK